MSLEDEKLKGKKFGRLTLLYRTGKDKGGNAIFKFKCDCGIEKDILYGGVRSGNTKSCGCLSSELMIERNYRHGMVKTPEYKIWEGMKTRCSNRKRNNYKYYGGRGIGVCNRWLDKESGFMNFYKDMGKRPSKGHSIDRIDNDGDYCKENCRWLINKEQDRNKRSNHMILYEGETKCLAAWAEFKGVDQHILLDRINKLGWGIKKAFETPVRVCKKRKYYYKGKYMSLIEISKLSVVSHGTLYARLQRYGWDMGRAVNTIANKGRGNSAYLLL